MTRATDLRRAMRLVSPPASASPSPAPLALGLVRRRAEGRLIRRHRSEFRDLTLRMGRVDAVRSLVATHSLEYQRYIREERWPTAS